MEEVFISILVLMWPMVGMVVYEETWDLPVAIRWIMALAWPFMTPFIVMTFLFRRFS